MSLIPSNLDAMHIREFHPFFLKKKKISSFPSFTFLSKSCHRPRQTDIHIVPNMLFVMCYINDHIYFKNLPQFLAGITCKERSYLHNSLIIFVF